ALQGIAAGLISPQVMSYISLMLRGRDRARAVGFFTIVNTIGFIGGQALTGLALQWRPFGLTWRLPLLIAAALCATAGVAAMFVLPDIAGSHEDVDVGGAAMLTGSLLLLLYPLIQGRSQGWPPGLLLMIVAGIAGFAAFVVHERRLSARGGAALIEPRLFGNLVFRRLLLMWGLINALAVFAVFMVTITMQLGLGFSPFETILATGGYPMAAMVGAYLSSRLVVRLGRNTFVVVIVLATLGQVFIIATMYLAADPFPVWILIPSMLVYGLAMGIASPALATAVLDSVLPADAGTASGIHQTTREVGAVSAVAIYGLVYFSVIGTRTGRDAYSDALAFSTLISAAVICTMVVLLRRLPRWWTPSALEPRPAGTVAAD
ncbi:MAG: MFS transporter, partial [Actinomycetota bacterium]